MLKKLNNSLFAVSMVFFLNLFVVAGGAFGAEAMAYHGGCLGAEPISLIDGRAVELEVGVVGVELRIDEPGFLLAEAFNTKAEHGDPHVVIEGAGALGADWLSGRLLPIGAGTYCVRLEGASPDHDLAGSRLVLAMTPWAGFDKTETGDETPADPMDDILLRSGILTASKSTGETGDETPADPMDDILLMASGFGGAKTGGETGDETPADPMDDILFTDPGKIPFAGAFNLADRRKTETGDETPADPMDDILLRSGVLGASKSTTPETGDETPADPMDDILLVASGFGGAKTSGENGDETPADPMDDILLHGGSPSRYSKAARLGLCDTGASGALACAGELSFGEASVSSLDAGRGYVQSYTFEVKQRTTLAMMTEGAAEWVTLYDDSGRALQQQRGEGSQMLRTVAPGRYWLRVGAERAEGWYSVGIGEVSK